MIARVLKVLTSTSIFIALNGLMVAVFGSLLYGVGMKPEILLAAFLVTFSVYNLNKATDKAEDSVNRPETASREMLFYVGSSIIATVFSLGIGALIGAGALTALIVPVIVALAYSVRLLQSTTRLKEILGVKSVMVAFSWAFTGALLPASTQLVEFEKLALTFTYIFIQLLVNTILFDILDMEGDTVSGVKTIPIVLGLNVTRKLLTTLNSLLAPWLIYCLVRGLFLKYMPALVFGMLYGYIIIWAFSRRNCNRLLLEVAVDGEWMPLVALTSVGVFVM